MPTDFLSPWRGLRIHFFGLFFKVCVGFCLVWGCSKLSVGTEELSYGKASCFCRVHIYLFYSVCVVFAMGNIMSV